jgi:hypothetical protein
MSQVRVVGIARNPFAARLGHRSGTQSKLEKRLALPAGYAYSLLTSLGLQLVALTKSLVTFDRLL